MIKSDIDGLLKRWLNLPVHESRSRPAMTGDRKNYCTPYRVNWEFFYQTEGEGGDCNEWPLLWIQAHHREGSSEAVSFSSTGQFEQFLMDLPKVLVSLTQERKDDPTAAKVNTVSRDIYFEFAESEGGLLMVDVHHFDDEFTANAAAKWRSARTRNYDSLLLMAGLGYEDANDTRHWIVVENRKVFPLIDSLLEADDIDDAVKRDIESVLTDVFCVM